MFLSETKNQRPILEDLQEEFGLDNLFTVEPDGLTGGLALFYTHQYIVKFLFFDEHLINIETIIDGNKVFMTFIYGDPVVKN